MEKKEYEYAILWHNTGKFQVKISDLPEDRRGVIMLPDGTVLNLMEMHIEYTNDHGNPRPEPKFCSSTNHYKMTGNLPELKVIKAEKI